MPSPGLPNHEVQGAVGVDWAVGGGRYAAAVGFGLWHESFKLPFDVARILCDSPTIQWCRFVCIKIIEPGMGFKSREGAS